MLEKPAVVSCSETLLRQILCLFLNKIYRTNLWVPNASGSFEKPHCTYKTGTLILFLPSNSNPCSLQTSSRAANIISPFKQVQNRRYNYPLDQEAWKISFELEINLSHARVFRDAESMSQSLPSH